MKCPVVFCVRLIGYPDGPVADWVLTPFVQVNDWVSVKERRNLPVLDSH